MDEMKVHAIKKVSSYCAKKHGESERKLSEKLYFMCQTLADPGIEMNNNIKLLIGADYLPLFLRNGVIKEGGMMAQWTDLGWTILGKSAESNYGYYKANVCNMSDLEQKMENLFEKEKTTSDEDIAENFYKETTYRDENGKYVVRLPFKDPGKIVENCESVFVLTQLLR